MLHLIRNALVQVDHAINCTITCIFDMHSSQTFFVKILTDAARFSWATLAITTTQVCMPCIHDLSYLQKAARVDPHRPTRTWWCDYANLFGCEYLTAKPWNSHKPHSPYYTELPTFLAQLSEMKYVFICHNCFYKYCAKTMRDSWVCNYFVYFQYAATTGMCSDMH